MEDKELQELFEAKRTTEANRHRQEELAAMIGRKARRTMPLWPLWTTSAAAAIALLIVVMPSLFSNSKPAPIQIAQAELPEAMPSTTKETAATPTVPAHHKGIAKRQTEDTLPTTADTTEPIDADETIKPASTIDTTPLPADPEPFVPAPRIMRRTSTMLACTNGCPEPEGTQEPSKRNIHIEFFSSQQFAEATAYTITFNK